MAELSFQERLQPSLLDRLTDDEPEKKRESRRERVITIQHLRQSVLRDLGWLLNTGQLAATIDLDEHTEVASSVLNYGVPELSGLAASSVDATSLEHLIREAIQRFEPRILADTLQVRVIADLEGVGPNCLMYAIEGELWARPQPLKLFLQTEIDLETGSISISESSGL